MGFFYAFRLEIVTSAASFCGFLQNLRFEVCRCTFRLQICFRQILQCIFPVNAVSGPVFMVTAAALRESSSCTASNVTLSIIGSGASCTKYCGNSPRFICVCFDKWSVRKVFGSSKSPAYFSLRSILLMVACSF